MNELEAAMRRLVVQHYERLHKDMREDLSALPFVSPQDTYADIYLHGLDEAVERARFREQRAFNKGDLAGFVKDKLGRFERLARVDLVKPHQDFDALVKEHESEKRKRVDKRFDWGLKPEEESLLPEVFTSVARERAERRPNDLQVAYYKSRIQSIALEKAGHDKEIATQMIRDWFKNPQLEKRETVATQQAKASKGRDTMDEFRKRGEELKKKQAKKEI